MFHVVYEENKTNNHLTSRVINLEIYYNKDNISINSVQFIVKTNKNGKCLANNLSWIKTNYMHFQISLCCFLKMLFKII